MKKVFLFLDSVIDRLIMFEIEYLLDMSIDTIILMAESHNITDFNYFYSNKKVQIFSTLQECLNHCDMIIVSDSHFAKLKGIVNKEIIIVDLSKNIHENINFGVPALNYCEKPVVAILSLGEFNDHYNTEILINKILVENGARVVQYYSHFTKAVIEACSSVGYINKSLVESHSEDYDVIVLTISDILSYTSLLRIMCDISPDIVMICVNRSYAQEEELKRYLYGFGNTKVIIRSPYISYEIVKGKTYPVYCGYEKNNLYCGSFEKNLYNVLKKAILKSVYLPKNIAIL